MPISINNLKLGLDEDIEILKEKAAKELSIKKSDIIDFEILRESVDARKKEIKLIYRVLVSCKNEDKILSKARSKNIDRYNEKKIFLKTGDKKLKNRILIVGTGPAGLFAGYRLASMGYSPILIERGMEVDDRKKSIDEFWKNKRLNPDCNIQFGEGGAGTFSDGKLTTRIKDPRVKEILDIFAENGAPDEIRYSYKPHIGTDILIDIIKNIRYKIISMGGEFRFSTRLIDIKYKDDSIVNAVIRDLKNGRDEIIETENIILAIGHSARDTYEMLYNNKIVMKQKPFAIGVRIEHKQDLIDENQYGKYKNHPKLKASEYRLTYRAKNGRSCYSFCMCPGGTVVASSSEEGYLVTNGMSEYARDKDNANSAIVVSVKEEDFESSHPLAGMEFQRKYEKLAFELGGSNYKAPVQLLEDFINNRESKKLGRITPSYTAGYVFKDINKVLPDYISEAIKDSVIFFDSKIKGFSNWDTVLTGIETRTSAPLRILRDENYESNIRGLYPAGEGAGYAGGIVSAAVDGMKIAEKIMEKYSPKT